MAGRPGLYGESGAVGGGMSGIRRPKRPDQAPGTGSMPVMTPEEEALQRRRGKGGY